jgi:hypothetical protein
MNILILGHGKSGTTIFVYKIAAGLPNCQVFSGGDPVASLGDYENAAFKYTLNARKGRTFDIFTNYLNAIEFDRKIWMARDPRDIAVSEMLFRWHKGYRGSRKQYQQHLMLVRQKEETPRSIPFHVIHRYSGHGRWPMTTEEVIGKMRNRYQATHDFVKRLSHEWFIFKYEDMIGKNYEALNEYLGFKVQDEVTIPSTSKKAKVARRKAMGDWRHWFTEEDVEIYKPAFLPYMALLGYDCSDWAISSRPAIDPRFSSLYVKNMVRKNMPAIFRLSEDIKDAIFR